MSVKPSFVRSASLTPRSVENADRFLLPSTLRNRWALLLFLVLSLVLPAVALAQPAASQTIIKKQVPSDQQYDCRPFGECEPCPKAQVHQPFPFMESNQEDDPDMLLNLATAAQRTLLSPVRESSVAALRAQGNRPS